MKTSRILFTLSFTAVAAVMSACDRSDQSGTVAPTPSADRNPGGSMTPAETRSTTPAATSTPGSSDMPPAPSATPNAL